MFSSELCRITRTILFKMFIQSLSSNSLIPKRIWFKWIILEQLRKCSLHEHLTSVHTLRKCPCSLSWLYCWCGVVMVWNVIPALVKRWGEQSQISDNDLALTICTVSSSESFKGKFSNSNIHDMICRYLSYWTFQPVWIYWISWNIW